jgi:uncharacterized membrane protein
MAVHWHDKHVSESTVGGRIADRVVGGMGSWRFVIIQTAIVLAWGVFNLVELLVKPWDPYPFILLNLVFSTQAAYASPLILMSANRAAQRDKHQADAQFSDTEETHRLALQIHDLVEINNRLTEEIHTLVHGATIKPNP